MSCGVFCAISIYGCLRIEVDGGLQHQTLAPFNWLPRGHFPATVALQWRRGAIKWPDSTSLTHNGCGDVSQVWLYWPLLSRWVAEGLKRPHTPAVATLLRTDSGTNKTTELREVNQWLIIFRLGVWTAVVTWLSWNLRIRGSWSEYMALHFC